MGLSTTRKVQLLHREISYDSARLEETNVLQQLSYPAKRLDYFIELYTHEQKIKDIVERHLKLTGDQSCRLSGFSEWVHGSFNVCIPIYIDNWEQLLEKKVMIRFPLPYKVGESMNPGNVDEKVRSEAATYIWMQEHCPDIPIPYLWGFGVGDKIHFTASKNGYVRLDQPAEALGVSHLLIDFIEAEQGRMLSESWVEHANDPVRKNTLFCDLSRIMLSLKNNPLPKIGSLTINDDGAVNLMNRPLSVIIAEAENDSCPAVIDRNDVYDAVEPYVLDLFAYHGNRLKYQPNAVNSVKDGSDQLEALTLMRGSLPNFLDRTTCRGPFYLTLTDLHQSNIFVEDDWHITAIIDLEWACSRPADMLRPPLWLTNQGIDEVVDDKFTELQLAVEDFLLILEEEEAAQEKLSTSKRTMSLANSLRENWATGRLWYFRGLDSLTGLPAVFDNHIEPIFKSGLITNSGRFWQPDAENLIRQKVADKAEYDVRLQEAFQQAIEDAFDSD